jgi:signal transduction histidine kinase
VSVIGAVSVVTLATGVVVGGCDAAVAFWRRLLRRSSSLRRTRVALAEGAAGSSDRYRARVSAFRDFRRVGVVLLVVDGAIAIGLTVGGIVDAVEQPDGTLNLLGVAALVVLTSSVAWRRVNPVLATLVGLAGLAGFLFLTGYDGDGAAELAGVALDFYLLGRSSRHRDSALLPVCVFAAWLSVATVLAYGSPGGSLAEVLSGWVVGGVLPYAAGRTLATRTSLTRTLTANALRLQDEQAFSARRAAAEERNRIARELHDVIAHSVSVMVVQTSAARRVAAGSIDDAHGALEVVAGVGREALVELRLIVGVLRRGDEPGEAAGLAQLDALVRRTRRAGLPVEVRIDGPRRPLDPGLDLLAYRVVQEALTNTMKHAGKAAAQVQVRYGVRELDIRVRDTGRGVVQRGDAPGSGHGLIGMAERAALFGGEVRTGPAAGGGFEVQARLPFEVAVAVPIPEPSAPVAAVDPISTACAVVNRWADLLLAAAALMLLEITVATSSGPRGPLVVNVVAAVAASCVVWRRRWPLIFLLVFAGFVLLTRGVLTPLSSSPLSGPVVVLLPSYTVAAWDNRRRAVVGLAVFLFGAALTNLLAPHVTAGSFVGATLTVTAAWSAGRAIRYRRGLTAELTRTSDRLTAERQDRSRLAVAGERTRVARGLHAMVAHHVAAMVVQAEAAHRLLATDIPLADAAMKAVEDTGREALTEMRRILGVLRHGDHTQELAPQPGLDQIYALIQHARDHGQAVELSVDGEPGTLPPGVDLAIYRILEDALRSARPHPAPAVRVALSFRDDDLELRLGEDSSAGDRWPTSTMRERVALCGGVLGADDDGGVGAQFLARLPRRPQGVLT